MPSPSDRAPHVCPECDKPFGKPAKLERHLLSAHAATLSIAPGILSPPNSPPSTSLTSPTHTHSPPQPPLAAALVATALAEANATFDAASPACKRCHRSFRTRKDLATHLLAKHLDADMVAASPPSPIVSDRSARSVKRPASALDDIEPAEPALKRVRTSGTKPPVTPRKPRGVVVAPKTRALAGKPGSPRAMAAAVAAGMTSLPSVLASEIKPSVPSEASPPSVLAAPTPSPVMPVAVAAAAAVAVLDFSAMGGFFANSDKSYYRLVDS